MQYSTGQSESQGQPRFKEVEKQTPPLAEKRGKITLQRSMQKWNGRNLWLLKILLHFGRTPVLIKAIHSPTP